MTKGQTLQDPFLNLLRKEKIPVSVYLVNGIKLQGSIDSFDQFVILLKNSVNQMVTSMRFPRSCRREMFACLPEMRATNSRMQSGGSRVWSLFSAPGVFIRRMGQAPLSAGSLIV